MKALPFLSSKASVSFSEVKVGAGADENGTSSPFSGAEVGAGVGKGEDGWRFPTGHLQGFSSTSGKSS